MSQHTASTLIAVALFALLSACNNATTPKAPPSPPVGGEQALTHVADGSQEGETASAYAVNGSQGDEAASARVADGSQEGKSASAHAADGLIARSLLPPTGGAGGGFPDTNYLLGKFDPAARTDFAKIGKPYADRPGMSLRREAFEAFQKMWAAAQREGVSLKIISSTRTFAQQKGIWEGKWARFAAGTPDPQARALKILEYSSMPGSSRHHWGTDFDLNDLNNSAFEAGGKHEKVYRWLAAHAQEYGFCQPYTAGRPHGYKEEKWHWSYTPLSKPLLEQYEKTVTDAAFVGFLGAETAAQIQVVKHYALGINAGCR